MPLILSSWRNARRSLSEPKPKSRCASSRTTRCVNSVDALAGGRAGCRTCSSARRPRRPRPARRAGSAAGSFRAGCPRGGRSSRRLSHSRQVAQRDSDRTTRQRRQHDHGGSRRRSSADGGCRSGTMIGVMPAASAARTPGSESSSTRQCRRAAPSRYAAARKMSGAGLPCATSSPPTSAAKRGKRPRLRELRVRRGRGVSTSRLPSGCLRLEPVEEFEQRRASARCRRARRSRRRRRATLR